MHLRYDRARIIFPANAPPVPSTGQFDSFFQAWHSLQPHAADPAAAMAAFFDAWQRIPAGPAPTPPTLDACQFTEFAAAFPAAHARHMRSGVRANAWRSTGVGHDELRNTAVLRWLLDRLGDHGQGPDLLVALLEHLALPELAALARLAPYHARVEQRLSEAGDSRVDIAIEGADFMLIIEAKVGTPEGNDQLERYHAYLQSIPGKRQRALIFLTPDGRPARNPALRAAVLPLAWATLAEVIDAHLRRHPGIASQPAGLLLTHFAEHVRGLGRKGRKKR